MNPSPPEQADPAGPLGYAAAPRAKRRKWLRRALMAVALPAFAFLLLRGFVPLRDKATFLRYQSKCLAFATAPGTVAYTEDAPAIARLTGGALTGTGWGTLSQNGKAITYYLAPEPLRRLEQTPGVDIPQGSGPVFLHGLRAAGGGERLVVVKIDGLRSYRAPGMTDLGDTDHLLDASVMRPATLTSGASVKRTAWEPAAPAPAWGTLTLMAGTPDPGDASHFTIDYLTPAGRGTIDGWLQADDTVKFAVLDGPLAQAPPPASVPASPYNPAQ